jgi:hypothetical protein
MKRSEIAIIAVSNFTDLAELRIQGFLAMFLAWEQWYYTGCSGNFPGYS